jgi:hypothetical protein
MKFSIRDLLLVTALIALGIGWMVDRYTIARRYERVVGANERLRDLLDTADPQWQAKRDNVRTITRFDHNASPTAAFATGAVLFGLAILLIVLAWQRRVDWRLLNRRCRE